MDFTRHPTSIVRSAATAGGAPAAALKALTPSAMLLAAAAMAAAIPGTALASAPTAADLFVAKVMVTQRGDAVSRNAPAPAKGRTAEDSPQDPFVEQVLKGHWERVPADAPANPVVGTAAGNQAAWPNLSFLVGANSMR